MEMQSSRRSAPVPLPGSAAVKKPRLSTSSRPSDPRIRPPPSSSTAAPLARADGESGGAYQPQPPPPPSQQQQQFQELQQQYKAALADLTFNSKPIITNLTIIAGENHHAAKAVAATICQHILEVPIEQKLPSLYLLDSIVKNIGRDYIKYFSSRLPEVFCKAYKQVDSSVRPGMRHLFGTWKGVFPPASLQMIEKELGFLQMANGSSGSAAPKADSQAQRPAHSIHVNPKYLEARQRLQQSNKVKEESSDDSNSASSMGVSAERSDKLSGIGSGRTLPDLPMKTPIIQRPQKGLGGDVVPLKMEHKDSEFSSGLSRQRDLGAVRLGTRRDRLAVGKPWYGAGDAPVEDLVSRRNGVDVDRVYDNKRESGSSQSGRGILPTHLNDPSNNSRPSRSWKNSEEEEYTWDDISPELAEYGVTSSSTKLGWKANNVEKTASVARGTYVPSEIERLDSRDRLESFLKPKEPRREERLPHFKDIDEHLPKNVQQDAEFDRDISTGSFTVQHAQSVLGSVWPPREQSAVVTLDHTDPIASVRSDVEPISRGGNLSLSINTSLASSGLPSQSISSSLRSLTSTVPVSGGAVMKQLPPSLRPPSSSSHFHLSPDPSRHPKSRNLSDHDSTAYPLTDQRAVYPNVPFSQPPNLSLDQDSLSHFACSQNHQPLSLSKSQDSQPPESPSFSSGSTGPFIQSRHQLPFMQQSHGQLLSTQIGESYGAGQVCNSEADISGQSGVSSLVAAIMKRGLFPSSSTQTPSIHPPLPSGPPPAHVLTSSTPLQTAASLKFPASHGNTAAVAPVSNRPVLPPLPPGPPPPSSMVGSSLQVSSTSVATPHPLSNLLGSLLAKGLISPSGESRTSSSGGLPAKPFDENTKLGGSMEMQGPSTSGVPIPSQKTELVSVSSAAACAPDMPDLTGVIFKPEVVREFRLSVINSLNDDLKHQCSICGLKFKLQPQFHSHLDWHESNSRKGSGKLSRRWYVNAQNWFTGSVGASHGPSSGTSNHKSTPIRDNFEPMVPADESQCLCALCGEPFEDFYCAERDEWMYRGSVYFKLPDIQDGMGMMNESEDQDPIVHAKCISRSSYGIGVDKRLV